MARHCSGMTVGREDYGGFEEGRLFAIVDAISILDFFTFLFGKRSGRLFKIFFFFDFASSFEFLDTITGVLASVENGTLEKIPILFRLSQITRDDKSYQIVLERVPKDSEHTFARKRTHCCPRTGKSLLFLPSLFVSPNYP